MKAAHICLLFAVLLGLAEISRAGVLKRRYYKNSCKGVDVEAKIRKITWKLVAKDPTLPAALIRMQFHDCFVRGCDASVLLDSTTNNTAEKSARPNLTLRGFDTIDTIKTEVEKLCPDTVSCADILALSSRDAVSFEFKKTMWKVMTGRRDGTISRASETGGQLPSSSANITTLLHNFKTKGLARRDLVALSGAHTIGVSHCSSFSQRLNGGADAALDAAYAATLRTQCRTASTVVGMDPESVLSFDNSYFGILKEKKGLFVSDAALLTDEQSARIVNKMLNSKRFFAEFALSMERLIKIGVLTGGEGEIRKKCNVVNS